MNPTDQSSLVASASSIDLGATPLGKSVTATVSLENNGAVPLKVAVLNVIGQAFSLARQISLPASIPAGGTYSLAVAFDPSAAGLTTGQLIVGSDASTGGTTVIKLSGDGEPTSHVTAAPSTISCSSASMLGAGTDACTVTMNSAAPSGGISVSLSSNDYSVKVPATVTIPANALSAPFTAAVSSVARAQVATLTASSGGDLSSFALTLEANLPELSVSATSLEFGNVIVDAPTVQSVTLTSTGSKPVTISRLTITGKAYAVSGITTPLTLNPNQTATLSIKFHPTSVGPAKGQLSLTSDSSGSPTAVISLSGTAEPVPNPPVKAVLCVHASMVGAGTDSCTVSLKSAAPSGGAEVNLSSSNPAVTVPGTIKVPANELSASFTSTVSPVTTGQVARLTASSGGVSSSFPLTLQAIVPTLSVGAPDVAFGNVVVNAPSTESLTLTSSGTAPVTISSVTLKGQGFTTAGATFPMTLNPGQMATLRIEFNPTETGPVSGLLTLVSNSSTDKSAIVKLSGTGFPDTSFANLSVGATPGVLISPTFMGFSQEWGTAQTMMGDSTTGVDEIFRHLVKNLTAYGSGPINIRIGGDSSDQTGEPTANTTQPFAELARALDVRFSLGVNLGSNDLNLAMEQAAAYVNQMPAGSLEAIEIGNEPDLYAFKGIRPSPYRYANYVADFNTWTTNIAPLLPSATRFLGPSWASPSSLANAPAFDSAEASVLTTLSQHYYVADGKGTNVDDIMLAPNSATAGAQIVAPAVATAHQYGIPFRMGEMNSLYDGGEAGISNAFETALWSIDAMFEYGNVGVDGVNWHFGNNAVYAPFAIKVKTTSTNTSYAMNIVTPLYYGMLFFQGATGNRAHLLPVTLTTQANVKAWATVDASGVPRLAIINKDESATGTVNVIQSGYSHAQIYRLTAPNYLSKSGVTFAGQTFDGSADGTIQGTQAVDTVDVTDGIFKISMPVTSAALVVFSK